MIKLVKKFYKLSWQDQWLFIEAFCLMAVVRLVSLLFPFRRLAIVLGKHREESPLDEEAEKLEAASRIGWLVETVSRFTPWESKCLVQAVTGKIILRQRNIANTLYLGVGRDERSCFVAHAWLRCGETIITGGQGRERFTMVAKFADHMNTKEI